MTLRPVLIQVIMSLLIFLFVYAALSKLQELDAFRATLLRSPIIGRGAAWVSVAVPVTELVMAVLLLLPRTRNLGLAGAFILMVLFTLYITYLLLFADKLPCSCGGVLRMLGWKEHLLFNLFFTLLAWTGIILQKSEQERIGQGRLIQ
jgi:uncharacterized membrane protein YphA (DoxX/SURF4 family)